MPRNRSSVVEVALRLDTEDYLTPESHDALAAILDVFERQQVRATFVLVGEKLEFLAREQRRDLLRRLRDHALGLHSYSHSRHPTIAEELRELSWRAGVEAFARREEPGLARFREVFEREPICYTQPGANWVPQAMAVLRRWGIPFHYSEGWNSYLATGYSFVYYGGVLNWSAPVAAPKPFLSGLPGNLKAALACLERELDAARRAGHPVNIVFHPTELVTSRFWDAENFGRGRTRRRLRPAPLRPRAEVQAALAAFREWVECLARQPGVVFRTAEELVAAHPRPAGARPLTAAELRHVAAALAIEPQPVRGLSAAEAAAAVFCALAGDTGAGREPVAAPGPCWGPEDQAPPFGGLPLPPAPPAPGGAVQPAWLQAACRAAWSHILATGHLPSSARLGVPLSQLVQQAARHLLTRLPERETAKPSPRGPAEEHAPLVGPQERAGETGAPAVLAEGSPAGDGDVPASLARWLKPTSQLHWDWPIFAPGFTAPRLYRNALLQAWTLTPV